MLDTRRHCRHVPQTSIHIDAPVACVTCLRVQEAEGGHSGTQLYVLPLTPLVAAELSLELSIPAPMAPMQPMQPASMLGAWEGGQHILDYGRSQSDAAGPQLPGLETIQALRSGRVFGGGDGKCKLLLRNEHIFCVIWHLLWLSSFIAILSNFNYQGLR